MPAVLPEARACVFDAYGTLFDVHSAVARHASAVGPQAVELSKLWRTKQLEYSWVRSLAGRHADFWTVTGDALDFAMASFGVTDPGGALRARLMEAYLSLDAYPEVPEMLRRLKAKGLRTAILSNGSPDMLNRAVRSAGIGDRLDSVLSIEEVGIYKPDQRVYRLAVDRLGGVPAERIAFLSSNAWDAAGAASFGFRVVWVNRTKQPTEHRGWAPPPAAVLDSLATLPEIVGA
jgi:2-haloacid dehalogenase